MPGPSAEDTASIPSWLGSVTSQHCRGSRNLQHTNASFSFSSSLIPDTQPCQQCQLTAGQLQSTKRERIRNRENSHRSLRGHLAVGRAFSASISPHAPQDQGASSCHCHQHSGLHSYDSFVYKMHLGAWHMLLPNTCA